MARSVGKSMSEFKRGLAEAQEDPSTAPDARYRRLSPTRPRKAIAGSAAGP